MTKIDKIMNPPGSLLMWMLVIMEVFMFGALLTVIARFRYLNLDIFLSESTHLQLRDGILFTLTLLVSGFLAAEGVHHFFREQRKKSFTYFTLSASSGLIFLVLKFSDFQSKSNLGLTIGTNDFWQYYWLLMGFHFLHVLVGVFILFSICLGIFRNKVTDSEFSVRGGVLFWHMCDVVWLMILLRLPEKTDPT